MLMSAIFLSSHTKSALSSVKYLMKEKWEKRRTRKKINSFSVQKGRCACTSYHRCRHRGNVNGVFIILKDGIMSCKTAVASLYSKPFHSPINETKNILSVTSYENKLRKKCSIGRKRAIDFFHMSTHAYETEQKIQGIHDDIDITKNHSRNIQIYTSFEQTFKSTHVLVTPPVWTQTFDAFYK